jgi:uncharacterized protein (TIGR02001 family)
MNSHDSQGQAARALGTRPGYRASGVAGLLAVLCAAPAAADDSWSATVAATSDYILRGVSQSHERPALQAGFDYQNVSGAYAGAWSSNVDPYSFRGTALELDLHAGFVFTPWQDVHAQSTYTRYSYLDDPRRSRYDYDEVAFTLKYLDRVALTVSWEPDVSAYSALGSAYRRTVLAYEGSALWPLGRGVALTAGAGYYDLRRLFGVGYWAGSAGLAWVGGHFEVDLARYVSDHTVALLYETASANGSVVVSAMLRF